MCDGPALRCTMSRDAPPILLTLKDPLRHFRSRLWPACAHELEFSAAVRWQWRGPGRGPGSLGCLVLVAEISGALR
eukprot:10075757-Alexandrium_andersonii.AAC.1